MMKSKLIKILLLLISAFLILSCGNSIRKDDGTLIYWSSNNTHEMEYAGDIVSEWNKINPELQVKFQPVPEGQSSEEVILAAVVGKTTPDIYSNMWQGDVEVYAQAGVLIALDSLDGFMEYLHERCDSAVIEEITSQDGHIYQIPWKINPIMQIYNKRIIKELELEAAPKTYGGFFAASEKFKKDVDGDGYVDRWFGYAEVRVTWWQRFFDFYPLYLAASGGARLIENEKAVFNNKHAVEVFTFLRELYNKQYFSQERLSARQDVFLDEIIGTRFTGPWEIAHANKYKKEGFEYSFSSMPTPDDHVGPAYTYCDPKNIVIFNTCPNPEEAWRFLKNMTNEQNDLKLLEITSQLPRRKKLNSNPVYSEYFEKNPKMKIFADQANYVRGTDATPVLKEVFDIISQEYEACVVYGTKSPEEAIAAAADAVDLLFLK